MTELKWNATSAVGLVTLMIAIHRAILLSCTALNVAMICSGNK